MKKLTTEDFVNKAIEAHGFKYNYSNTNYIGSNDYIYFVCSIHGEVFQRPLNHIQGKGCPKCSNNVLTNEIFKKRCNIIHNNFYNYSLVKLKNTNSVVKIICPTHGIFNQKVATHLEGFGCKRCSSDVNRSNTKDFIEKSKLTHGDKYDYSITVYVNKRTKVDIKCLIHGDFKQRPDIHTRGSGCPTCKTSKGEISIINFLTQNKIKFIYQYTFNDCKNINVLPFDFYLPDYNICIEFNGRQHYMPIEYFGGDNTLKLIQKNDKIKKQYCKNNNIKLKIIKYTNNLEKEFNKIFKN